MVMSASMSDPACEAFAAHLRGSAGAYFGGSTRGTVAIRRCEVLARPRSTLYRFHLRVGDRKLRLQIKTLSSHAATGGSKGFVNDGDDRPRIHAPPDDLLAFRLEHDALSNIHTCFHDLNDARFGAVRVFEWMPQVPAIVMELLDQPSLRTLWIGYGAQLSLHATPDLREAFRNAGAWLRRYHGMPSRLPVSTVQLRREEFTQFVDDLSIFLERHVGQARFFSKVRAVIAEAAHAHMPVVMPAGLEHGDFAMRNVLVSVGQRVTVIDTRSLYRTSIYRDIGYFLGNLFCSVFPAVFNGSVAQVVRLGAYRRAFLAGYFEDEPVPAAVVCAYELQHVLERWSSVVARSVAGGRPELVHGATRWMRDAFFRQAIERRLRLVKAATDGLSASRIGRRGRTE